MFPNFRVRLPEVIAGPGPHILAEVTLIWTEQISIYLRPLTSAPIPNSDAPVFGYEDRYESFAYEYGGGEGPAAVAGM